MTDLADETWDQLSADEREKLIEWVARKTSPVFARALAETGVAVVDPTSLTADPDAYHAEVYTPPSTVVPTEPVEAFDGDIAHLLYACLVRQGAQPPVGEIWPVRDARAAVAAHFYASEPPKSGL